MPQQRKWTFEEWRQYQLTTMARLISRDSTQSEMISELIKRVELLEACVLELTPGVSRETDYSYEERHGDPTLF